MSEANAPSASQPTAAQPESNGSGVIKSFDQRSADVFGSDVAEGSAADAGQVVSDAAAGSTEPDANAKARAERRAAYERLKAEERVKVDAMALHREREQLRAELAAEREKNKAYERHIDPTKLTKEQFFGLAEQNPDLTPQELGEWLRERMANPELAAAQAATRVVDPKLSALEKKIAEQQAVIDNFMSTQQRAQEEAQERAAASQFFEFTQQNAATAPYSAWFLQEHGTNEYYTLARKAAESVPQHAGPQAILDEVEELLLRAYGKRPPETGNPQRRQASPTPQHHAAAQAPTHVTNSLAQQRSSVVDEEENWASLPFEERSARVFR